MQLYIRVIYIDISTAPGLRAYICHLLINGVGVAMLSSQANIDQCTVVPLSATEAQYSAR